MVVYFIHLNTAVEKGTFAHKYFSRLLSSMNPGLKFFIRERFSICHWNLNSVAAHNDTKMLLLKVNNSSLQISYNLFIRETYLDFKTLSNDDNLDMSGYNLVRSDHPSNSKRGWSMHLLRR